MIKQPFLQDCPTHQSPPATTHNTSVLAAVPTSAVRMKSVRVTGVAVSAIDNEEEHQG